jgi:ArsR family transcriptional regulator
MLAAMPFTPGRPLAEAKADLFKALAHPARVRVLELLAEKDHTVGDLAAATGLELSHLSQQVSVLRRAGVVDSRRVGSNVICSLRDPDTAELLAVARRLLTHNLRQDQALLAALDEADDAVALAASRQDRE